MEVIMKTLKQAKYDLVIENIKNLILEKGINTLTITDIAKEIGIGEATIYRYFNTKVNLAIEIGIKLWEEIYQTLKNQPKQASGYENIAQFFNYFNFGFSNNRSVFKFLQQFDNLMLTEKVDKVLLSRYDDVLQQIKVIYDEYFKMGLDDNTIKVLDKDAFYYTTTHMLLGICYRAANQSQILKSDELINDSTQINMAIEICLNYIRRK